MARKATMSFEERRQALYDHMAKASASQTLSQEIKFSGDEVAKFLRELDKVERESLKSKLVFK